MSVEVPAIRSELLGELERLGLVTTCELRLPHDLSAERFEAIGAMVGQLVSASRWWAADFLLYAERTYGAMAPQLVESLRMSPDAMQDAIRVGLAFPPNRRRPCLTFSHHRTLAAAWLDPFRERLLDAAERDGLNVPLLRDEVAKVREQVKARAVETVEEDAPAVIVEDSPAGMSRTSEPEALRSSYRIVLAEEALGYLVASLLGDGFPIEQATVTVEAGRDSFSVTFTAPTLSATNSHVLAEVRVA